MEFRLLLLLFLKRRSHIRGLYFAMPPRTFYSTCLYEPSVLKQNCRKEESNLQRLQQGEIRTYMLETPSVQAIRIKKFETWE